MQVNKTKLSSVIKKSAFSAPVMDEFWPIPDQYIGLEMELEGQSAREVGQHRDNGAPFWEEHTDGSLRGGIEYVLTQPLMGSGLREAIDYFYKTFTKFTASPRTSIHVHLNMRQDNESVEGLRNLVVLYYMYEEAFFKTADENRKWCSYCNAFEDNPPRILEVFMDETRNSMHLEDALVRSAGNNHNRYYGLNLNALFKFGTLEFRHFPLVHDKERLIEWIKLIMELKKAANDMAEAGLAVWDVFAKPEDINKLDDYMPLYSHMLQAYVDTSRAFIRMNNVRALAQEKNQLTGGVRNNAAFTRFCEQQEKLGKVVKTRPNKKAALLEQVDEGTVDRITAWQRQALGAGDVAQAAVNDMFLREAQRIRAGRTAAVPGLRVQLARVEPARMWMDEQREIAMPADVQTEWTPALPADPFEAPDNDF